MPSPVYESALGLDLSPRVFKSTTVAASPAAGAETTICTLTVTGDLAVMLGVELVAWAAFTVGTNGVSGNLKIRRTDTSGSTIAATGATTQTAANLSQLSAHGFDANLTPNQQVYVATLTVGSGSAESTVSAVYLRAIVI